MAARRYEISYGQEDTGSGVVVTYGGLPPAARSPGKPLVVVNGGGRAGGTRQVEDRTVRDQLTDT